MIGARRIRARNGMRAALCRLLVVAIAMPAAGPAFAVSEQVPVGARGIAMGGAFSALADDGSALYWNPAGLATIGHQELTGAQADLFGSAIRDNLLAGVIPLALNRAIAFDWYHSGLRDDPELGFGEDRFDFAFAVQPWSTIALGATAKYLTREVSLDNNRLRHGWGLGFDFGARWTPRPSLIVAAMAQDFLDTRINDSDAGSEVVFPRNLRGAIAYTRPHLGTIEMDVDDRAHLGIELPLPGQFALRGGGQRDLRGDESPTWSGGAGFRIELPVINTTVRIDYAYEMPPVLPATHHFGTALEFNFNPSLVRIEKVEARDVFASQYKSYDRHPFGVVRLRNTHKERPLSVRLSVKVPSFHKEPSAVGTIELLPGARDTVALTAAFDRMAMDAKDAPVQVEVVAEYASGIATRKDRERGEPSAVLAPGRIRWSDGVAQAAAFVTVHDPVIDKLAHDAVREGLQSTLPLDFENLGVACAAFDVLQTLRIKYFPDALNPYDRISTTRGAIDNIRYPRETLEAEQGDCDDHTALVAALLGNLGIATRLVDVPKHLFLMFDSGIPAADHENLGLPRDRYVIEDGRVWIPLEATAIPDGFATAWQRGADKFLEGQATKRLKTIDVAAAQVRHAPAEPVRGLKSAPAVEGPGGYGPSLRAAIARDSETITAWRLKHLESR